MINAELPRRLVTCAAVLGLFPAVGAAQSNWQTPCEISTSSYTTGVYRNAFFDAGIGSQAQIDSKVQAAYNQLFVNGGSDQKILVDTSDGMSYIHAVDSNDIRSEGMSYGMMAAVQMGDQALFNRLWNFAVTRMLRRDNNVNRWFIWRLSTTSPYPPYSSNDRNPAPDGEEYMAAALIFAHNRWGSGNRASTDTNYQNYKYWATEVIRMIRTELWNSANNMIVFSPATSYKFTDPSYHLPVFYELFSVWENQSTPTGFWRIAAGKSRQFLSGAMGRHPDTYLTSDYTDFSGAPVTQAQTGIANDNQSLFAHDSWRVIQNVAMDVLWCTHDSHFAYHAIHQLNYFNRQGGANARAYREIANPATGALMSEYKGAGIVGMNAVGALLALDASGNGTMAKGFLQDLWNQSTPTGTYRYYAGLLHMFGLLHVSGKYKIYKANAAQNILSGTALDASLSSTTQVQPRVIVKNNTSSVLANYKAHYFFTTENGKTPVLTDVSTPNSSVSLQQLDTRSWAVVVDFTGKTLNPGQTSGGTGETFSVRYSDNSTFDKSNDFSQPVHGSNQTATDRIAVYDGGGAFKMGSVPADKLPSYSGTLKSTWSNNLVTASGMPNDAETRAQPYNSSWTSQTWQVEPVASTGYVRLKNNWNGAYLNVQSEAENAKIVTYQLNIPWTSQLWTVESVSGSQGVRLKNAWSGKYLTVTDTSAYSTILAKALNTGWASQIWSIQ